MKMGRLYDFFVKKGLERDPRSAAEIREVLRRRRKEYRALGRIDREAYDRERLQHPYDDTRILNGDPQLEVKTVLAGIDMEGPEIILADRLNARGACIDLVLAHHPEGVALAGFYHVMAVHEDLLRKHGIPSAVGKDLVKERIDEVKRRLAPSNHTRSVEFARLVDIPFMCVHTPADNAVTEYLQRLFDRRKPKRLSAVVDMLKEIPEYRDGIAKNAGPRILIGDPKKAAGKIFVDMTGGTEGPKKAFARLSQAGVGTIVSMHLDEDHFKTARGEHINVVIAGHIASDSLGLNLLIDEVEKQSPLKVITCSGFVRVKRSR